MDVRNLPSRKIDLSGGVVSNVRGDDTTQRALRVAQNVDCFDEFRSLGKVPGSTRVSNSHGAAVVGLHHFEFTDLDGVRKRHQLSLASDGTLRRIESDLSLTSLQTGFASEQL